MTNSTVANIVKGWPDASGAVIREIDIKIDGLYAVYRTDSRVMIQFADDQALGADQRKSLVDLYVIRGSINSSLDELRATGDQNRIAQVARYERRLADALIIGLQGQVQHALTELESLKQDLSDERGSRARLTYLLTAFLGACVLMVIIAAVNSPLFRAQEEKAQTLWFAAAVGVVGAFFSIAIAIRNKTITTTLITRDTVIDAILRIFVGALAGALMLALIKTGAFSLTIGNAVIAEGAGLISTGEGWLLVLLVAFVAGFFERLVPDLLTKATPTDAAASQQSGRRATVSETAANERNPLGNNPAHADPGAGVGNGKAPAPAPANELTRFEGEDCCGDQPKDSEVTEDVELPEALGGVETVQRGT